MYKKTTAISILIIFLVSFGVYSNTLFNGFVYDDTSQILENPLIIDVRNLPRILTTSAWGFQNVSTASNFYRPMMNIAYMIIFYIFGLVPIGFHLTNIAFHAATSALVFLVVRELLLHCGRQGTSVDLPAFAAGLLFAAHPVHTEVVAWAASFPELSLTFFVLISFYLYMKCGRDLKKGYFLSVVSFFLATLSKEPALVLPFVLMAYDYCFPPAPYPLRPAPYFLKRYIPYVVAACCYLFLRFYALKGFAPLKPYLRLTGYEYLTNLFPLFGQYIEKLFVPVGLNAYAVFHPVSLAQTRGILSLVVSVAFILFSIAALRKSKILFLSSLFVSLPLVPALLMFPTFGAGDGECLAFAERYLYLPSFGFVLIAAFIVFRIRTGRQGLNIHLNIILIAVLVSYCAGTIARNAVWRDDYALFSDIVRQSPHSPFPHYMLGNAYAQRGQPANAATEFKTALGLKPDYAPVHHNLGMIYMGQKQFVEASAEFETALKFKPDYANAYNHLGVAYAAQGRIQDAIQEYRKAIEIDSGSAEAHNNLGIAYAGAGRIREAFDEFNAAIMITPGYVEARHNLDSLTRLWGREKNEK